MNAPLARGGAGRRVPGAAATALAIGLAACLAMALAVAPALSRRRSAAGVGDGARLAARVAVARTVMVPDRLRAYGSLSYRGKRDVSAIEAGELIELTVREGDALSPGRVVARLRNVQLEHAAERARDGVAVAEASLALADSRLFEGRLGAEARLIGLERARLEVERARRELAEAERRQVDQETLLAVGGVTEEAVRAGRLALASSRTALDLLELDTASRALGLRDDDLLARGLGVPPRAEARAEALIALATEGLAAERSAAAARLEAARSESAMARAALDALTLRAGPGIVAGKGAEPGELVAAGGRILTIIDMSTVYAVVRVGEAEAARLAPGMAAIVGVDATGLSYEGLVEAVSPLADARSGTLSVRIALSRGGEALRPGMFARADIALGPELRRVVVSEEALFDQDGDSAGAFAVVAGRASRRALRLGDSAGGERIVLAGLAEGDAVILRPDRGLKEGDYVEIDD